MVTAEVFCLRKHSRAMRARMAACSLVAASEGWPLWRSEVSLVEATGAASKPLLMPSDNAGGRATRPLVGSICGVTSGEEKKDVSVSEVSPATME